MSEVSPPLTALLLDRNADVPIGVQLAWAIKARIAEGSLDAGERLPGLRDLADALRINVNTVRAVYARLESEGLLESHQGSGTFVSALQQAESKASAIAARAAGEARAAGVDPREVASALYVQGNQARGTRAEASKRSTLRTQIAALEQALSELEAQHPALVHRIAKRQEDAQRGRKQARLPSAAELEQAKSALLRRIGVMQAAIDAIESDRASASKARKQGRNAAKPQPASPSASSSSNSRSRRAGSRPAVAGA
jgi:DNA-binding transcriptional regulator YhcF (GntR family)